MKTGDERQKDPNVKKDFGESQSKQTASSLEPGSGFVKRPSVLSTLPMHMHALLHALLLAHMLPCHFTNSNQTSESISNKGSRQTMLILRLRWREEKHDKQTPACKPICSDRVRVFMLL